MLDMPVVSTGKLATREPIALGRNVNLWYASKYEKTSAQAASSEYWQPCDQQKSGQLQELYRLSSAIEQICVEAT